MKNYNEKISVIIPIYNSEKYLNKCIESILNQTYTNLEILLINDGSTDNSSAICKHYMNKDNRIKFIDKKNEGVSATKNLGIKTCTGNYIAFIDSDDWICPDYFETLYNNIKAYDSDVAIVSYNVVKENGEIIPNAVADNSLNENEVVLYEKNDIMKELLKQKTIKNFVCKLYKKDILLDIAYPLGVTYEDIVFTFDVMNKTQRVVYINKRCYNYVKRKGSITATITEKNLKDFSDAIFGRYTKVNKYYPELLQYNMYAFLESTIALSIKFMIFQDTSENLKNVIHDYINIIVNHVNNNEAEFFKLLNDYQKLCIYLMKYNEELYFSFLKERQNLKIQGKLK